MKPLICVVLAGVVLAGGTLAVGSAEAGDRRHVRDRRAHHRYEDRDHRGRGGRYFSDREVYLVREYYGPRYRRDRGPRYRYYRSAYLPHGWHKRIRPYPVYIEREVIVLPHGYRRGVIDGHAVVYNSRGLIIDVAVLF